MLRLCDRAVVCFPCADGNPLANLTAELPDRNIFVGVSFRRIPNPPPNNFNRDTCVGFCEADSQLEADDCAARAAFDCVTNHEPPPNPENPTWPTPRVCNTERTCENDGLCYTIPACTVIHFTSLEANAIAQSLCDFRVHDPSLTTPCGSTVVTPPMPPTEMGSMVTYEKAWNESPRGDFISGNPCPWPDSYTSVWESGGFLCLCQGDNADPYQWPFGEGTQTDPATTVVQSGITVDVSLQSHVIDPTVSVINRSSRERLYLRTAIAGGAMGKHVVMQGHWTFPGGSWVESVFNEDTQLFEDATYNSDFTLEFNHDPCAVFNFTHTPQVFVNQIAPASGDLTYEFDVPAGLTYYACVWIESATHLFGPSTLHLTTTIANL